MHDAVVEFLPVLGRTTLWLALAALLTAAVLRVSRASWPTAHRVGWLLVLLVGWAFIRWSVAIPWYEAPQLTPDRIAQAADMPLLIPSLVGEGGEASQREALIAEPGEGAMSSQAITSPIMPGPAVRPTPARRINWPMAALSAWALGILALPTIWLFGYVRFVRSLPLGVPADEAWEDAWRELLSDQGVCRAIPLRVTRDLGPMLCRLPRGYELLLPERLWRELDAGQRKAILRHELAHYVRGDVWKSLAARALALPHWFNPFAWWAVRRFDEAAEWACDSAATADEGATDYAKALVRLGEVATLPTIYGSAARGRTLAVRVRRLLSAQATQDSTMKKTLLIAAALCLASFSAVRLHLVAKEPTAERNPAAEQPSAESPAAETVVKWALELNTAQEASPAQKMVETARLAYQATMASFNAETTTLDHVFAWSLRWMTAAEGAAKDGVQKVAAVQAHLDRMREIQMRIAKLYEIGTRGGEGMQMAAANYYVAEAERRLEQLQAQRVPPKAATWRREVVPAPGLTPYTAPATVAPSNPYNSSLPGTSADRVATGKKKPTLYDGKDFNYWADLLQTELSPERRTEAIRAMAAFGGNSYAKQAASKIVEAMQGLSIWTIDSTPEGRLKSAALEAYQKIPPGEAVPVAIEAIRSGNANQRMFALVVLRGVTAQGPDAKPIFVAALADNDEQVRQFAICCLALVDPAAPELAAALKRALASENPLVVRGAIDRAAGITPSVGTVALPGRPKTIPAVAPDLVQLLKRDDGNIRPSAANALVNMGDAALDAIENAFQSSDVKLVEQVKAVLEAINRQKSDRKSP